ncbi:MAG: DUF2207 domain-containing protein, partial [Gallicola sp.]|nr:DUF2207 domain-containing protein [Gallicola sp.]
MKKLKVLFLALILLLIPTSSYATSFNSHDINVELLENGDARVTNVMNYNDDTGTEHYIIMGNLGDSEIRDFQVSKNGVEYTTLPNWNVSASREEKKDKAGIYNAGDHLELCFGIGDYGDNSFVVTYTITKAVKNLSDAQYFFFRLINDQLSEAPQSATATIKGPSPFTAEDVRMWAFGYEGEVNLEDGAVVLKGDGPFGYNSFMTPLIRFNPGTFSTVSVVDKSFAQVLEEAFEGSSYDPSAISEFDGTQGSSVSPNYYNDPGDIEYIDSWDNSTSYTSGISGFFRIFKNIVPLPLIVLFFTLLGRGRGNSNSSSKPTGFIKEKELKDYYYRDIPFKGG